MLINKLSFENGIGGMKGEIRYIDHSEFKRQIDMQGIENLMQIYKGRYDAISTEYGSK